mmetsp:Transcript_108181/g.312637  ORF Transcript_108181/g.312637 Transcript_108181/m.312637 type:complete len:183 (+) Transcript_108181:40-588(+)
MVAVVRNFTPGSKGGTAGVAAARPPISTSATSGGPGEYPSSNQLAEVLASFDDSVSPWSIEASAGMASMDFTDSYGSTISTVSTCSTALPFMELASVGSFSPGDDEWLAEPHRASLRSNGSMRRTSTRSCNSRRKSGCRDRRLSDGRLRASDEAVVTEALIQSSDVAAVDYSSRKRPGIISI